MKFDLHIHSEYSRDSRSKLEDIFLEAQRKGLDGVAITEHAPYNSSEKCYEVMAGLKESGKIDGKFILMYGTEFDTKDKGHVLGIYSEPFDSAIYDSSIKRPCFKDVSETVRSNGGCVIAAHPFDPFGRGMGKSLAECNGDLDAIEAISGASPVSTAVYLTGVYRLICRENNGYVGGSDAHNLVGIGSGHTIADADSAEELIRAIKSGNTRPGMMFPYSIVEAAAQIASMNSSEMHLLLNE